MRIITIAILLLTNAVCALPTHAQTEPEYTMEIGAAVNMNTYLGDFNSNIGRNIQPGASLLLRHTMNPRSALRFALDYGKAEANSENASTAYPDYSTSTVKTGEAYSASNSFVGLDATYEYNFWPYGTGREYRGAKRITPFVFIGIGAIYAKGDTSDTFGMTLPLGLGIKYKVAERINLNLQWAFRFTTTDMLDGVKDPYHIPTSGLFKNHDCLSAVSVAITYSFKPRCKVCHNDD